MKYKIKADRVDDAYLFKATNERGSSIIIDNTVEGGGTDEGPQPMQVVLMALATCSGIDVVSILNKARQAVDTFSIEVEAERVQEDGYASFGPISVHYLLTGDVDPRKLRRAISLSQDKYCSVAMLLKSGSTISARGTLNGQDVGKIETA